MKPRLKEFSSYAAQLLPHEVLYLLAVQQFQDPDNQAILERILHNASSRHAPLPFDPQIDKRKYSRLKQWISDKLSSIDVDLQLEWIMELERKIMTDSISPGEERDLLRRIRSYQAPYYYFVRFYELALHYRQYLLVRIRHREYGQVQAFIAGQAAAYRRSLETYERLHQATVDIVAQYSRNSAESGQWETWLAGVFADETMDGLNRYLAIVRLTFIYLNYRQFDRLLPQYEVLDGLLRRGTFYSRRILVNYYANRVLLHTRSGDLQQAAAYGFLSIRQKNADYLHYVNNLASVLLRQNDPAAALKLLQEALPEARQTSSTHSRVGFAALYVRCLVDNQRPLEAEQYAERFLRGYKEAVFEQRWHLFFSAYLQALLRQEKYDRMLRAVWQYRLMEKEKAYQRRAMYLPTLAWYHAVAQYKEGRISREQLAGLLRESGALIGPDEYKQRQLQELTDELRPHIPEVLR
ncbi:MAG: hypothetical protein NW241_05015 [Bacteroidia bacterium]|nr:hypothetical protein [Bacteroidia bacterium]